MIAPPYNIISIQLQPTETPSVYLPAMCDGVGGLLDVNLKFGRSQGPELQLEPGFEAWYLSTAADQQDIGPQQWLDLLGAALDGLLDSFCNASLWQTCAHHQLQATETMFNVIQYTTQEKGLFCVIPA